MICTGPPPRARGPRGGPVHGHPRVGTTPACAGTTSSMSGSSGSTWDHPRVRGDHREAVAIAAAEQGPPPRARGPLPHRRTGRAGLGTTPACAGTTSCRSTRASGTRDHPRVRGDHDVVRVDTTDDQGPPPRARGPLSVLVEQVQHLGTTPACAGTTSAARQAVRFKGDHPRVRGDHGRSPIPCSGCVGPPPRARGPHPKPIRSSARSGTTPACAGTTMPGAWRRRRCRDHPRVRGDHLPISSARF